MLKINRKSFLGRSVTLTLGGISTMTLQPAADYYQHISSAEDMFRRSWGRTGEVLRNAMEKQGAGYGEKQAATCQ